MYMNKMEFVTRQCFKRTIEMARRITNKEKIILRSLVNAITMQPTQKYSMLDVKPQLNVYKADRAAQAYLEKRGGLFIKRYELRIFGTDTNNKLPDGTGRQFQIRFWFSSWYNQNLLRELLSGAREVGFVDGFRGNWSALAFTASDGTKFLVNRTVPTKLKHSYSTTSLFDIGSTLCKDIAQVDFTNGLQFSE